MDEERARGIAIQVPSDDREGREEEVCLYGSGYYQLEDAIVDILMGKSQADIDGIGDNDGSPAVRGPSGEPPPERRGPEGYR